MKTTSTPVPRVAVASLLTALCLTGVTTTIAAPSADAAGSCVFADHRLQKWGGFGWETVAYGKKVVCPNAGRTKYAIRINCVNGSTATGPYVTAGQTSGATCLFAMTGGPKDVTNFYIITA